MADAGWWFPAGQSRRKPPYLNYYLEVFLDSSLAFFSEVLAGFFSSFFAPAAFAPAAGAAAAAAAAGAPALAVAGAFCYNN